ncbi:MAG: Hsp20/alpha crystallin family protein [Pseudomonadota bacterium]
MFFATTARPQLNRHAYANTGRTLERFMDEALRASSKQAVAYTQDETSFTLTLDLPGIAKDQLGIAIEGAVVRISSKEGAARRYNAAYELPLEIDAATSEAKLEHGVLTLKLVKKVPVSNAAELQIQ